MGWWRALGSRDADAVERDGLAAVHDLTADAPVFLAGPDGTVRATA